MPEIDNLVEQNAPEVNLPAPLTDLAPARLAKLAREIAMNIRELPAILKDYGLTAQYYDEHILTNEFFKRALETIIIEWNGALSTHQRIKVEAAATLEDSLHNLAARMNTNDEALPAVVETAKLFAKIAGLGEPTQNANSGEKFVISIDLGEGKNITFERDVAPAKEIDLAAEPVNPEISAS